MFIFCLMTIVIGPFSHQASGMAGAHFKSKCKTKMPCKNTLLLKTAHLPLVLKKIGAFYLRFFPSNHFI